MGHGSTIGRRMGSRLVSGARKLGGDDRDRRPTYQAFGHARDASTADDQSAGPRTIAIVAENVHEADVVSPDALHRIARRFSREASLGVGRYPVLAVRPAARASHVQRLYGRARICRRMRL